MAMVGKVLLCLVFVILVNYSTSSGSTRTSLRGPTCLGLGECPQTSCKPGYTLIRRRYKAGYVRHCYGCGKCAPRCKDKPCLTIACPNKRPGTLITRPGKAPCVGCPVCPVPIPCPIPLCVALPPDCPKKIDTFIDFGNRKCPGCQQCVRPCPFVTCLKPSCPNSEPGRIIRRPNQPPCSDCSVCPTPPPCPVPGCLLPPFCPVKIPTFFMSNGRKCPGCPDCPQICPFIKCGKPTCSNPQPGKIIPRPGKKPCLGCPVCPEPPPCPPKKCAPLPANCPKIVETTFNYHGRKCTGCPICAYPCPFQFCQKPACPNPIPGPLLKRPGKPPCTRCAACPRPCLTVACQPIPPDCPKIVRTTNIQQGRKCPGCPVCARPCPHILCLNIKGCRNIVPGPVIKFQGRPCLGCATCGDKCPRFKCRPANCPRPYTPIKVFNGVRCKTCPRCPKY